MINILLGSGETLLAVGKQQLTHSNTDEKKKKKSTEPE